MTSGNSLVPQLFPRAAKYHPEWILASVSGSANSLWLTEWLAAALDLRPGMRVLDLGRCPVTAVRGRVLRRRRMHRLLLLLRDG